MRYSGQYHALDALMDCDLLLDIEPLIETLLPDTLKECDLLWLRDLYCEPDCDLDCDLLMLRLALWLMDWLRDWLPDCETLRDMDTDLLMLANWDALCEPDLDCDIDADFDLLWLNSWDLDFDRLIESDASNVADFDMLPERLRLKLALIDFDKLTDRDSNSDAEILRLMLCESERLRLATWDALQLRLTDTDRILLADRLMLNFLEMLIDLETDADMLRDLLCERLRNLDIVAISVADFDMLAERLRLADALMDFDKLTECDS